QGLRMLDSYANGERLALDGQPEPLGPAVHRARRVTDRQHDGVGPDLVTAGQLHRPYAPPLDTEPSDLGVEAILHVQPLEVQAKRGQHFRQAIGSHVWA